MRQVSQECEKGLKNETSFSKMRQVSQECENQSMKPAPGKDYSSSKNIKTYKDFKESLSEGTREKFLKFVSDKTAHFQFPIINMDDYLSSHDSSDRSRYLHYWSLFQSDSQNATNSHLDHDDKKLWTKKQWIFYLGSESKLLQWQQLLELHGMKWCMGMISGLECEQSEKMDRMNFRSWGINYREGKIPL
jgi:hypothetical protein